MLIVRRHNACLRNIPSFDLFVYDSEMVAPYNPSLVLFKKMKNLHLKWVIRLAEVEINKIPIRNKFIGHNAPLRMHLNENLFFSHSHKWVLKISTSREIE